MQVVDGLMKQLMEQNQQMATQDMTKPAVPIPTGGIDRNLMIG